MKNNCSTKFLILFVLFAIFGNGISAQNVSNVDVNSLSEEDIQRAQREMEGAGLSFEQAAELARQRGASEQQILQLRMRMQGGFLPDSTAIDTLYGNMDKAAPIAFSERDTLDKTPFEESEIFGTYLFNSRNLTFEPDMNIQTPKDYIIGIGDEMIINIWGNSQIDYQLQVNSNGQINIPNIGPISVAGLDFNQAENRIKKRLTSIYADMAGDNPQTFAQINMGNLRSIRVNIVGDVVTPGTYTLPVTATVFNALYLSGGPNKLGSFRNIKVIRNNKVFKLIDIYKFLLEADPSVNIKLENEDILFIPGVEIHVDVQSGFKRSAIFEMKKDDSFEKLIKFAGGFKDDTYLSNLRIIRKRQSGQQILEVPVDETSGFYFQDGDKVITDTIPDEYENRVIISGAVYHPGEYEWKPGLSVHKLIEKAGGPLKDVFLNRGIIFRENENKTKSSLAFNIDDIISGKNDVQLQAEDSILIKTIFELEEPKTFTVSGEVIAPGEFQWSNNITLGDAIFMAGGFSESADSSYIEIARQLSKEESAVISDTLVHIFTLSLSRDLRTSSNHSDFVLEPFDRISVRQAPGYTGQGTVFISGEVKYAGGYALNNRSQRISDLVKLAGGITARAFPDGAIFIRNSEVLGIENVAVDLKEILRNPASADNLYLQPGDALHVPEYAQTVKIIGSVQSPFSIVYEPGKPLKYYIDRAGGFSSEAQKRKSYVIYPNGETSSTKSFIVNNYPKVLPGSTIVVPVKPESKMDTSTWLAIASTLSSIAVAVAVVLR